MLKYLTSGSLFLLLLLVSCNSGWFIKEKPKPYYFSKVKSQPAYHSSVTRDKAQTAVVDSSAYQTKPDKIQPSGPANSSTSPPIPALVSAQVEPVLSHEKPLAENKSSKGKKQVRQEVKSTKKQNKNWLFLSAAGALVFLSASVFALLIPRTKGLASWAKQNPIKARWIIAAAQIFTGFSAYFIGRNLAGFGISTTEASTYPLLGLAAMSALAYPDKNKSSWLKYSFQRNKVVSLLLVLSGFFLFMNLGNREVTDKNFNPTAKQISEAAGSSFYANWQEKFEVDTTQPPPNSDDSVLDLLMIFLAILLLIGILMLSVLLVCTIECGGSGLVVGLSFTGIIFFGVAIYFIIRGMIRRSKKPKAEKPKPRQEEKASKSELKWF